MRVTKCQSCKAPVVWMRTAGKNKWMPVDADGIDEEEIELNEQREPLFDSDLHTSHFATCPEATRWRTS